MNVYVNYINPTNSKFRGLCTVCANSIHEAHNIMVHDVNPNYIEHFKFDNWVVVRDINISSIFPKLIGYTCNEVL